MKTQHITGTLNNESVIKHLYRQQNHIKTQPNLRLCFDQKTVFKGINESKLMTDWAVLWLGTIFLETIATL